ncbi:MAG: hypothetical protein AB7S51_01735 [Porticoccaceae bacterium]
MSNPRIRLVRPVPDPLGLFIRAGQVAQEDLQNFITSRAAPFSGVVFEAKRVAKQKELLSLVLEKRLDAVFDPMTQPMATIGGYGVAIGRLPWAENRPHALADLSTNFQQRHVANEIAQFAVEYGFTQVLAPTHLIFGPDDPWLDIDLALTRALRLALDRQGAPDVQIQYSLALGYEAFRTEPKRTAVIDKLRHAQCDGLWLNIDGCGCDSSPTAITRYCDASSEFQALKLPIVADHVGGLMGLSLLAFGGVGGLAHGITLGERFDSGSWRRVLQGKPFAPRPRVYLPHLDLMLDRGDAEKLFEVGGGRAKAALGCRDTNCCRRGVEDMLQAPARHFLYQRTQQIAGLGQIPESLRPSQFLEELVRPASDTAVKASTWDLPEELTKKIQKQTKRLNALRTTLGPYARQRRDASFAIHPATRAGRRQRSLSS